MNAPLSDVERALTEAANICASHTSQYGALYHMLITPAGICIRGHVRAAGAVLHVQYMITLDDLFMRRTDIIPMMLNKADEELTKRIAAT